MQNTLYTNDNLYIMNGMDSQSVDLIYLDPPFNSKRMYSAPIGTKGAKASFKDMWSWKDIDESYLETMADKYPALVSFIMGAGKTYDKSMMAYLTYMAQRIIQMHRILKDTGSIYLHCDSTASHYLKVTMDEIFGKKHFKNEIVWCYKSRPQSKRYFGKKHDSILFYTKSENYTFNWKEIARPLSETTIKKYKLKDADGRLYRLQGRGIKGSPIKSQKDIDVKWEKSHPELTVRDYLDSGKVAALEDWWEIDIINQSSNERTGYPTQKPLALLRRIIKASSKTGDVVFDPFCGCATACVAAQQLGRKWIGIDIEEQAVSVLIDRLSDDGGLFRDFTATKIPPKRTDIKEEPINQPIKERLYIDQNGACNACGVKMDIFQFEIDHIIPTAKGGGDYYDNYQLLCPHCNRTKGDRTMEYLRMKIKYRQETMKTKIVFGE
jgi:site-specific DNA-methyltransferase (adenine-specific)